MKYYYLLALALLLLVITPVAAVDYPYSETLTYTDSRELSFTIPYQKSVTDYTYDYSMLKLVKSEKLGVIDTIYIGGLPPSHVNNPSQNTSGQTRINLGPGNPEGTLYYNVHFENGAPKHVNAWIKFDDWNYTGSGTVFFQINYAPDSPISLSTVKWGNLPGNIDPSEGYGVICTKNRQTDGTYPTPGLQIIRSKLTFENTYTVNEYEDKYNVYIDRKGYYSTVTIADNETTYIDSINQNTNINRDIYMYTLRPPLILNINDPYGNVYLRNLLAADDEPIPIPDNTSVTVYVKNSQNDALIANAHILISASVNDNLHEVINETLPSGIYKGELQPTGGGMPNPDYYRLIVTAEGYNSIMPYIDFEFDEAVTIYAVLEPIGGAPLDENNTFIDFYVRDLSANPISGATVNFGGYTLITNSAGYTIFEVDKNKAYSWTVSKAGYGALTGNAVIGSNARHTINTVIAPAVTPTTPTAIPTSTHITPTPTMTAPTGEPVSNWLEWFAAHFGMVLGGGVEIGKIFMWLCFTVPVGVYVGKEAKAGAAGFMAGAGIVTLFFVLIGWVPIWIVVLLALIIGLLYAKVINNSDNGGGR